MFFEHALVGDRLPAGTLCLTFDDGPGRTEGPPDLPGPRTAELGAFLRSEGVPAAFFAVGKFAREHSDILAALQAQGHLVANHTDDHPSLPAFVAKGGDVVGQLARADAAIGDALGPGPVFFRAPYGDWRLRGEARSNVAAALNHSPLARSHVGPVGWDVDGLDVGFWRDDRPAEDCAAAYLEAIERAGRGIVLLHDSTADVDAIRARNRALGLVRRLVPELRRRGYRFVRLDDVPQVASATRVAFAITLTGCDGRSVTAPPHTEEVTFADGPGIGPDAVLGVVEVGEGRWALRGSNGRFLSPRRGGEVVADAPEAGPREAFTVEIQKGGRVTLRTEDGTYLTRGRGEDDRLRTGAAARGERENFTTADPFAPGVPSRLEG